MHKPLLAAQSRLAGLCVPADVTSVAEHFSSFGGIRQVSFEHRINEIARQTFVIDWEDDFDASVEIARHHVGAAAKYLLGAAIAEIIDATMFEKPSQNAVNADVFAQSGDAGAQTTGRLG